jgi:hypothetical protein
VEAPTIYDTADANISDLDLFLEPNFMVQDILPTKIFDTKFPFIDTLASIEPQRVSSFSRFSSRLPALDDTDDGTEGGTRH